MFSVNTIIYGVSLALHASPVCMGMATGQGYYIIIIIDTKKIKLDTLNYYGM
jgi:hypothetical protein